MAQASVAVAGNGVAAMLPRKRPSGDPSLVASMRKMIIAQKLYKGKPKKKGGKLGKAFALQHCWALLQHNEKWRTRNNDVPPKSKKSSNSCSLVDGDCVDLDDSDDEDSDGRRCPTPSSAAPSRKRPPGRKAEKEKLKKGGDNTYKESVDNMMLSRKELVAERKEFKMDRAQRDGGEERSGWGEECSCCREEGSC
ncbi:hypothetical protein BAE44_0010873 [Dichanthelium oligosanthes]|uniref:No apical meristem-associated C-terminal domain-containing protein n=1 Tax=Dichanthelium oligosanthes TaxID=888268 RepID=A0A1E5VSM0_9POAL|nr:hypothetical protein BAE44_0010873 [Dichanthelium oligosanthes]